MWNPCFELLASPTHTSSTLDVVDGPPLSSHAGLQDVPWEALLLSSPFSFLPFFFLLRPLEGQLTSLPDSGPGLPSELGPSLYCPVFSPPQLQKGISQEECPECFCCLLRWRSRALSWDRGRPQVASAHS